MSEDWGDIEVNLLNTLKTIKDRVLYILQNYPEARNNDLYLWLIYVRIFDKELSKYIKFIPYELIKKAPSFESIRRVRQKIQEQGMLLPTDPEVLKKRRRLAKAYRKVIHKL